MDAAEQNFIKKLKDRGHEGVELFEKVATRTVELKEKSRTNRCQRCWHDKISRCICSHIPALTQVKLSIKAIILMHYKEYLSAGNDAKLLKALLPGVQSELFIFGKVGEWEKFQAECSVDPSHTILLWPADDALTVDDFVTKLPYDSPWRECRQQKGEEESVQNTASDQSKKDQRTLRVIVLDGVYSQARAMFRAIKRRFPQSIVPPYIALHPDTLSVYHRAQKNYSQSSAITVEKSSDPKALHICTVEAFALLMKEFGEWEETTKALIRAVEVNNLALIHSQEVRPTTSTSTSVMNEK